MKVGRSGVWLDEDGTLRTGTVVELFGRESLTAKTFIDGEETEVTVNYGSFHKIDGSNHDSAATFLRDKTGVEFGYNSSSRSYGFRPNYAQPAAAVVAPAVPGVNVSDDNAVVTLSEAVVEAFRQLIRQVINKKKVTGSYTVGKGSKKASKKA